MNIKHFNYDHLLALRKLTKIQGILEENFATKSFKPYYFPFAKAYFRMNVLKLSPLLNFVRGI